VSARTPPDQCSFSPVQVYSCQYMGELVTKHSKFVQLTLYMKALSSECQSSKGIPRTGSSRWHKFDEQAWQALMKKTKASYLLEWS